MRLYLGMMFLILAFILPIFGFLVPLFDFPTAVTATLIGLFTLGGPELMMILAVICLGKRAIIHFKKRICKIFKRKMVIKGVSKFRHYFGLILLFGSGIPLYLNAYFIHLMPEDKLDRYYILLSADVVFILSFFILGKDFWEKFKNLFVWKLPSKN
ncbi:MAG: hypothetical protein KAR79_00645 [Simkaniaceae bacterium]|nr:hypothetical protein [Simkaniaceae bacterium]